MKTLLITTLIVLGSATGTFAQKISATHSRNSDRQIAASASVSTEAKKSAKKGDSCCKDKVAMSPRGLSQQVMPAAASHDPDLAHLTPRLSPRAEQNLGRSGKRFEVAPVK